MKCGIYAFGWNDWKDIYIGQSTNIGKRWVEHSRDMLKGRSNYKVLSLYKSLGTPNFTILEECSGHTLNSNEVRWIEEFNSVLNGLNICSGGLNGYGATHGSSIYTEETVLRVYSMLIDQKIYSYSKISKDTGMATCSIGSIVLGINHSWLSERFPNSYRLLAEHIESRKLVSAIEDKVSKSAVSKGIVYPVLVSKGGEEYTSIPNMRQFARDNDLDQSALTKVLNGIIPVHKGFRLKDPLSRPTKLKIEYKHLLSPEGNIYHIKDSIVNFSKEHGLDASTLSKLLSGKCHTHKGWKLAP